MNAKTMVPQFLRRLVTLSTFLDYTSQLRPRNLYPPATGELRQSALISVSPNFSPSAGGPLERHREPRVE